MDGWGGLCGVCQDAAKIQEGQAQVQRQLQDSARKAARAAERHLEEVREAKWAASANHAEAMRAEADRLEELQKQTQILLEGQITNEEAYLRGFDLEDEYLDLLLTEDGRVCWEIYDPYLVARLNAAYRNGAQDRLEKEFSSNFPGLEYMKQEAFGHGYAGSKNCSIVYLHHLSDIYPAKLNVLAETGLIQSTNSETGKLEWQWMPAYATEELNDAYDAGAQKYLEEQNTVELVAERLEKTRTEKELAQQLIIEEETRKVDELAKFKKRKRRNIFIGIAAAIILVLVGGVMTYLDSPHFANNILKNKKPELGMTVTELGIKPDEDRAIYRYQKNLWLWGAFGKPGHPIFAIQMSCKDAKPGDQYEQIGGIKCGDLKDSVFKKFGKAVYEVCWDLSDPVNSPIGIFYPKEGLFWGLDRENKISSMGRTTRKRYPVDEGTAMKCSELIAKDVETLPAPKPVESPITSTAQSDIPPMRNIGEMTITFSPNVDSYYPPYSKKNNEEGRVVVRMIVDETGSVRDVALLQSSGFPRLDKAGVDIARDFKFKPSYLSGKPAAISTNLMIKFNLRDK